MSLNAKVTNLLGSCAGSLSPLWRARIRLGSLLLSHTITQKRTKSNTAYRLYSVPSVYPLLSFLSIFDQCFSSSSSPGRWRHTRRSQIHVCGNMTQHCAVNVTQADNAPHSVVNESMNSQGRQRETKTNTRSELKVKLSEDMCFCEIY